MTKYIVLAVAALVAGLAVTASASAYDRNPITVAGLYAGGWGATISIAEYNLKYRYHGIASDWCEGVVIAGDAGDSSWVDGSGGSVQRYWDKLACAGTTHSHKNFVLIYDAKSRGSWQIYRLKGVTSSALYGG